VPYSGDIAWAATDRGTVVLFVLFLLSNFWCSICVDMRVVEVMAAQIEWYGFAILLLSQLVM
jgi:hypothetical protein